MTAIPLPLSPLEFSVLLALAEGDNYAYGIVKAIAERSGGSIRLAPGNLYQVMDRLLARDWVRELSRRSVPEDADRRRRYYAITATGREALRAEAARIRGMLPTLVGLRLLPRNP